MSELFNYIKVLKNRGPTVAYRELKSRFIRENPKKCIYRIMDVCEEHNAKFTFFFVGISALENKQMIRDIVTRGHEVACHGFHHFSFNLLTREEIYNDINTAKNMFKKEFDIDLKGFRAPYLNMSETVYEVLKELSFDWSSSIDKTMSVTNNTGIAEYPVDIDDWNILIKQNITNDAQIFKKLLEVTDNGTIYLMHPWRMGQKRYINSIKLLLEKTDKKFVSISEFFNTGQGVCLSGDIGETSIFEIIKRLFKK